MCNNGEKSVITASYCGTDVTENLASGKLCYLLNENGTQTFWSQKIGTDAAPVLGDANPVYKTGTILCDGSDGPETTYSNTASGLTQTPHQAYLQGDYNEKAIFHGYNLHEGEAFILFDQASLKDYEQKVRAYFGDYADQVLDIYPVTTDKEVRAYWEEIYGAVFFDYPHHCLNRLAVSQSIPVYQYYFTKSNGRLGPWHSGEEVYLYGNIPEDSRLYDSRDRELSQTMQSYLLNFVRTGDPNGEGLPDWPQNLTSSQVMEFGDETRLTQERKQALFAVLDRMQGWDL